VKKYFEKLGIKVLKTMAQTAVGIIGTGYVLSDINWETVISASLLSGLVAILMNLSDLKEGE
jgi:hypothetical protein